jgi:hypothetical protein
MVTGFNPFSNLGDISRLAAARAAAAVPTETARPAPAEVTPATPADMIPAPPGGIRTWPGLEMPGFPGWPGRPDILVPPAPPVPTPVGPIAPPQPYTQLAETAIGRLRVASREMLTEALRTVQAKQIAAEDLMVWLERRTRIGEVLGQSAEQWSADTLEDFALAFQMDQSRKAVMDTIVALAILNARDAEAELRSENAGPVTTGDLLQNRRVVFQYPPAGSPLEPPYVVLVAVEHQDTRRADDVVNAILGSLVSHQGYKMPREAAGRLV